MSIENNWSRLDEQQDDDLSSMLQGKKISKHRSQSPLEKIKRNLLINMTWCVVICILYVLIIFYFRYWQVQLAIGIVLLFTFWAFTTAYKIYRKINTTISANNSLLAELKRHHLTVADWMSSQQRVALFVYPVSATGGFMLGGALGSGKSVDYFMSKPLVWLILLITIIVLVPLCYYLAKWMSNYAFGKHLKALQQNIQELEEEK
jgi:predicted neutral ceramidase superfamily lipid hydrolase